MLYNNLSAYLKTKYGTRLSKICIDGGFTCPNRDGKCGTGGCIFCGGRGAGEHIDARLSIRGQVEAALRTSSDSDRFIAYFQSFTNTYAPTDVLRRRYDEALIDPRILVLAVGTRPDCIDCATAELLCEYRERLDVWVELGLQTASDDIARLINRGYTTDVFLGAAELLNSYQIPFVVHTIIGLPGESEWELDKTVDLVNSVRPFGVKLHSMYVMRDTALADMYYRGEYTPLAREEYVALATRAIARLNPETVLHRITGDCPRDLLVAPDWNTDKNGTVAAIQARLRDTGMRQGSLYSSHL